MKVKVITVVAVAFTALSIAFASGRSQSNSVVSGSPVSDTIEKQPKKMKIEIWSDVVCPFCYIGKTKFEQALNTYANKNNIEVEWKSYQLMPEISTQLDKNIDQILSEAKGIPLDQAKQMNAQAAQMGKQAGLQYNFDKAIVANTFKAHQFLHFAKSQGKQTEAEALMFSYYFTEGKNVDDTQTLVEAGKVLGFDTDKLKHALEQLVYASAVKADISQARQLGVTGVPFFVFDRKYAVSGAQSVDVFAEVINKSFTEWQTAHPDKSLQISNGAVCTPDGNCK